MILTIRTDQPQAELILLHTDGTQAHADAWHADRTLADTLLPHIHNLIESASLKLTDLTGIIVFTGSGSFTGLRIGTTVANALAYGLNIPITTGTGEDWKRDGLKALTRAVPGEFVVPSYDREPNITN